MKKIAFVAGLLGILAASALWAESRDERLIAAIRTQNLSELQMALENGANINAKDPNEKTALMLACSNQWFPAVKMLVEAGANASYKNNYEQTALMFTARDCTNDQIAKYLVSNANANINDKDNTGKTVLMYAIENKSDAVLLYLIQAGAEPNAVDNMGNTALMLAVQSANGKGESNELAVKRLVKQTGINWNAANVDGNTVFMLAVTNKNANILKILLTENTSLDHNLKVNNDQPLLFYAIQKNASETIIGYLMDDADYEYLLTARDFNKRNLEWYIKKYKNDYAKRKLEQIKREWGSDTSAN